MEKSGCEVFVRMAVREAREMANGPKKPVGELLFPFARRLRAIPGADSVDIMALKPAFDAFAETLDELGDGTSEFETTDRDDLWEEFAYCWGVVKYPEGSGALKIAFDRATEAPIVVVPAISRNFVQLVGTAYYLQIALGAEPFMLPVRLVGLLFGKTKMHGTRLVRLLLRYGFIEVVREAAFGERLPNGKRRAREFRFRFDRLQSGSDQPGGGLACESAAPQ